MNNLSVSPFVEITLLGPAALAVDGREVALPKSRKCRALFAYLAASQKPASRDWLSQFLFADTSDPKGNLRWCLSRLKSACADSHDALIVSDSKRIWMSVAAEAVDLQRLMMLADDVCRVESEFEFFESATQQYFLAGLDLAQSTEYETWRATTQSRISSTLEAVLETYVESQLDQPSVIKFAHLLVSFAPHSEKAWSLLVAALAKTKQTAEAQKFLQIAHQQLNEHRVLHTGLLALAADELKLTEANSTMDLSLPLLPAGKTKLPTLLVRRLANAEGTVFSELEDAISAGIAANKNLILIGQIDDFEVLPEALDLVLVPAFAKLKGAYQLDLQLVDDNSGLSLWSWQVELHERDSEALILRVRKWLGERFELDIPLAMFRRASQRPVDTMNAADLYYMALPRIHSPAGYSAQEALALLQRSLQVDANFGPALCATAWVRVTHAYYNESERERAKSLNMARRAIELSPDDASIVGWAGIVIAHLERNVAIGLNFANRAQTLNPHSPLAVLLAALMHHYNGEYAVSLEYLDRLVDSDIEPLTFLADTCYALNFYQQDDLPRAVELGKRAVSRNPKYMMALRVLAASLARSGKADQARVLATRMVEVDPSEYLQFYRRYSLYTQKAPLERICEDLRSAGIPDLPPSGSISALP